MPTTRPPPSNPFKVFSILDAVLRRRADAWLARNFNDFTHRYRLGQAEVTNQYRGIIMASFIEGAKSEIERLSSATRVDFRSVPQSAITEGAKLWFRDVKAASQQYHNPFNVCSLPVWEIVLTNGYEHGANFIHAFLWPANPNRSTRRRPARARKP